MPRVPSFLKALVFLSCIQVLLATESIPEANIASSEASEIFVAANVEEAAQTQQQHTSAAALTSLIESFEFPAPQVPAPQVPAPQVPGRNFLAPTPLSERSGLINHAHVCYMNSVTTALFGAVPFRGMIYESTPFSSIMFFLAQLFGSLQTATGPIRTDLFFMKNFKMIYPDWQFGTFQCSLEFFNLLLIGLGPEVEAKMTVNFTKYRILENDHSHAAFDAVVSGQAKRSVLTKFAVSNVEEKTAFPQLDPTFASIQDAFDRGFRDQSYSGKYELSVLSKITGESFEDAAPGAIKEVPIFDFHVAAELPETLVLGIKRTAGIDVFYNNRMAVDPTLNIIDIDGALHTYKLQSFVYFIESIGHYVSYVCDYSQNDGGEGIWYRYNDSSVARVVSEVQLAEMYEIAATNATFVVYVRSDSAGQKAPEIPERYMTFINLSQSLNDIKSTTDISSPIMRQNAQPTAAVASGRATPDVYSAKNPNTSNLENAVPDVGLDDYELVDLHFDGDDDDDARKNIPGYDMRKNIPGWFDDPYGVFMNNDDQEDAPAA